MSIQKYKYCNSQFSFAFVVIDGSFDASPMACLKVVSGVIKPLESMVPILARISSLQILTDVSESAE